MDVKFINPFLYGTAEVLEKMANIKVIPGKPSAYDAKIKRIKLDITATETILKMSKEDFDNPTIKPHFQHHPTGQATPNPEDKK